MLRWGNVDVAETLDEMVAPSHTALILWDYAAGLVDRAFDRGPFVANSRQLAEAARACGVPVFYSRQNDMTFEDVGAGLIRMRMRQSNIKSAQDFVSVNAKGTAAGEFAAELRPAPGDVIFDKFMPSSFFGTNLAWRLRARGIKCLVFAGISVETGVDNSAREAINQGLYAVIARDAVSSTSKRRHDLAMALIEELHDVSDTRDIVASWQRNRVRR